MKSTTKYFVAGFVSVVAVYICLCLLGLAIGSLFDFGSKDHDIQTMSNSISPDQQHVATIYSDMGGGAAGWCYISVNLRKVTEPFDSKNNRVFDAGCSSNVAAQWAGNNDLLITYTVNGEIADLHQASSNNDGAVRISYLAKQEPARN